MTPKGNAQQHGTSLASTLPVWQVVRMQGGKLGITCPRQECGGKAIVNKKKWLDSRPEIGRSCTYCFKTNRVP